MLYNLLIFLLICNIKNLYMSKKYEMYILIFHFWHKSVNLSQKWVRRIPLAYNDWWRWSMILMNKVTNKTWADVWENVNQKLKMSKILKHLHKWNKHVQFYFECFCSVQSIEENWNLCQILLFSSIDDMYKMKNILIFEW